MPATRLDTRYGMTGTEFVPDLDPIVDETPTDLGEVFTAAFKRENTIGSLIAFEGGLPDQRKDSDFNPWLAMTEREKLSESFSLSASLADNEDELNALRRQVKNEQRNAQILDSAGAWGVVASITAGVFDPVNLIPIGGAAVRTYKTGSSVLRSGMLTGGVALGSTAISETALHQTQIERTFTESAVNMAGATILGGALGVVAQRIGSPKIHAEIEGSMNVEPKIAAGEDSVGAARVDGNVGIRGRVASAITKALAFDPLSRTLTNEIPTARLIATELAENPIEMDKFTGTAVESLIKAHEGKYVASNEIHLAQYADLQKELGGVTGVRRAYNRQGMSRSEFNELVAKQVRNPDNKAPKQVKQAANAWRNELYNPMKDLAIKAGLLPDDVDVSTAVNYLNRSWNREKMIRRRPEFIDTVSRWLANQDIDEIKAGTDKGKAAAARDLEDIEYQDIAAQIYERIVSSPDGRLPYDYKIGEGSKSFPSPKDQKLKSPFKSRSFNIPDEMVDDFLENDIERLGARYLQQISPDIELTARFGDIEMSDSFKNLQLSFRDISNRITDPKKQAALQKEYDEAVRDLAAMRDRIRGVYGMPIDPNSAWVRTGRAIRNLNYMRFMGGVVASSIPDIARTFTAEGFANTFRFGLKPLLTNLKQFKVSAAEGKRYGIGSNALFNRAEVLADIADYTQGGTAIERALQSGAQGFSNINIMNQWTVGMKQLHAVTMQNSVIDTLLKGNGGAKFYRRLERLGISRDQADDITGQVRKYGDKVDGVHISGAKKWDDPDLERVWGAAIRKESDRVIIVPGQEKPLFMSTEMGKTFMQFRSFMFAATQRMFIAGIQGQEANYFGGFLMLASFGMLSTAFKNWDAGRQTDLDPTAMVIEGIDRSGALGMLMEVNNTMEKLSGNGLGIRSVFGVSQPSSRYASRSAAEAFLGPTFGSFFSTGARVLGAAGGGYDWTDSDTRAVRRLLPYQNLTFLRQAFDKMEQPITNFVTQ